MRLPSIETLYQESLKTFKRFPLSILTAIAGSATVLYLIEKDATSNYEHLFHYVMALITALPLFTTAKLLSERYKFDLTKQIIANLIAAGIATIHFFLLPADLSDTTISQAYRYVLPTGVYFLTISFAAFAGPKKTRAFWEFNKTLVISLAKTVLFTGVLFFGIVISLLSIDFLFNISVDEKLYPEIWVFIAGVIAPWMFLAGFPSDFKKLEKAKGYAKSIKFFGQYILLPLIVLYAVILYLYAGKILLTNEWPEGLVSHLIIFFAFSSIATQVLIYPIIKDQEQKWAHNFKKTLYPALIPLTGMLFYAIYLRISQYGITENRYYVVLFGLWILALSIYFIVTKKHRIKTIVMSFCAVVILSNFGPWSAYAIAQNSQTKILLNLIENHQGIDQNGNFKAITEEISTENASSAQSIIKYLIDTHGKKSITKYIPEKFIQDHQIKIENISNYSLSDKIAHDLLKIPANKTQSSRQYYYWHLKEQKEININGYQRIITINNNQNTFETPNFLIEFIPQSQYLTITSNNNEQLAQFDLQNIASQLIDELDTNNYNLDAEQLTFTSKDNRTLLIIQSLSGQVEKPTNTPPAQAPLKDFKTTNFKAWILTKY